MAGVLVEVTPLRLGFGALASSAWGGIGDALESLV